LFSLTWIKGLIRRRKSRLIGMILCVGLAVTLVSSLGMFFVASKARMTKEAAAGVPVDWQVQLSQDADLMQSVLTIKNFRGIAEAQPIGYSDIVYLRSSTGGTVQTTGQGKALGIPDEYASSFPGEIRFLVGSTQGVLLAQQTAANLQATVGDTVTVGLPGGAQTELPVQGIVDLSAADSLFQSIGSATGAGPTAPPDNVVLMPLSTWHQLFDQLAISNANSVQVQIHVKLAKGLPADPGTAFADVIHRAHNLEAELAGTGIVGNNLAAQLDGTRSDASYTQILFLFLGLPCVVLAALLVYVIAMSGRNRRRQEQALLTIRGAAVGQILRLAAAEAALVGILGVVLGLGAAVLAGRIAFGTSQFGTTPTQAVFWATASATLGFAISFATILLPAWHDVRGLTVRAAQVTVRDPRPPLWSRIYLDIIFLAGGGIIFWQSMQNAYQVILAPEGVPTISINYLTLLAPLMLWIGFALLAWRLSNLTLARGKRFLRRAVSLITQGLSGLVTASMSRQQSLLSRGLVIMALAVSFAVTVAVFNTTYMNQARVDAQLTNGADVTVSTTASSGLPEGLPQSVKSLTGVVNAEPMQHRFTYVGKDLQDLYGINPELIQKATPMSDAFFSGGSANQMLSILASKPDGVLVSAETVNDFQLQPGDLIRIRVQFASDHAYHVVDFHYVGIVREFPTAPRDSFLVANAAYITRETGSSAYETLLVKTSGSPPVVASRIRDLLGPASGATVQDVETQLHITLSGLTAIDLSGLTKLELVFAVILAAAASGLVFILGLAERRRILAISAALGAKGSQLSSFVWSEAFFVTVGGMVLGALAGWSLSLVMVRIMSGVFDPPPEHLFVPWAYLALLLGIVIAVVLAAGIVMIRTAQKPVIETIRDL
jgi:putative ABC transport system permease protein